MTGKRVPDEVWVDDRHKGYFITMLGGIVLRNRKGDPEIALRFVRTMADIFDLGTVLILALLLILVFAASWFWLLMPMENFA